MPGSRIPERLASGYVGCQPSHSKLRWVCNLARAPSCPPKGGRDAAPPGPHSKTGTPATELRPKSRTRFARGFESFSGSHMRPRGLGSGSGEPAPIPPSLASRPPDPRIDGSLSRERLLKRQAERADVSSKGDLLPGEARRGASKLAVTSLSAACAPSRKRPLSAAR
jgi:hypothetical protein